MSNNLREDLRRMIGAQLDNVALQRRLADPSIPIRIRGSAFVPNAHVLFAAIPEGKLGGRPYTLVVCKPEHVEEVEELLQGMGYRA